MDEDKLIKLAKNGDCNAFEKLIQKDYQKSYRFVLSLTNDPLDGEDILQNAFIKAYKNINKFKGKSKFCTWLWRIIRNECINYQKSRYRKKAESLDSYQMDVPISPSAEKNVIENENRKLLNNLLENLSIKYKEVIILIELQEMSYQETANILGISVNGVKVRLHRAREKLMKLVENMGDKK